MGFLDKLFGRKQIQTIETVEDKTISKQYEDENKVSAFSLLTTISQQENYFRKILESEFPQFTIKEYVAVPDLVGNANDEFKLYKTRPCQAYKAEWGQPYTFVLYQDGVLKGVVLLGGTRSHNTNVKVLVSRAYAKKLNVPYINFYTHMDNEVDYVIARIKAFLNK